MWGTGNSSGVPFKEDIMPFVADGIVRVSDSECIRKLQLVQVYFNWDGEPTLTFNDRVENMVD